MRGSEKILIIFFPIEQSDDPCNKGQVFLDSNLLELYFEDLTRPPTIEDLFVLLHERGHILAFGINGHRHTEQDAWDCGALGLPEEYQDLPGFTQFAESCLATYDSDRFDDYGIPIFPGIFERERTQVIPYPYPYLWSSLFGKFF